MYQDPKAKIEVPIHWTKYLMSTHPVVFITTIGIVKGKPIVGVAPFATCLDTSYEPPYITFFAAMKQHSLHGEKKNKGEMNTVINLRDVNAFVVNIPGRNLLPIMDIVAFPYERKFYKDKVACAGLTKVNPFKLSNLKLFPPLIKECLAHIKCELIDIHRPKSSDHYTITGKVISASYNKKLGVNSDAVRINLSQKTFHHTWEQTQRNHINDTLST